MGKLADLKHWICRTMVLKPLTHLVVNWGVIFLLTLVVVGGNFISLHELQFNDFLILQERDVRNFFAHDNAKQQSAEFLGEGEILFRSVPSFVLGAFHLYESSELLSGESLNAICAVEEVFILNQEYPFYCHTLLAEGEDTNCLPQFTSMLQTYFPDYEEKGCRVLEPNEIEERTNEARLTGLTKFLFNNDNEPTIARSSLVVGTPLGDDSPPFKNFSAPATDFLDEEAVLGHTRLMDSYADDLFDFFGLEHNPPLENAWNRRAFQVDGSDVKVKIYSFLMDQSHLNEMILIDQGIVSLSFLFVLVVVWAYVGSGFLAVTALLAISMTMIVALFFYAVIFQINYFTTLHVVSFFIILAIGANNFYVISDAWKQSETMIEREKGDSEDDFLIRRLEYTYTRSALSVFNTSMTTFIAFIANLISPISIIAGFGLFSGVAVLVNFLFVLNVHPTHIIVHHKFIKGKWCSCCGSASKSIKEEEGETEALKKNETSKGDGTGAKDKEEVLRETSAEGEGATGSRFERFRSGYLFLILKTPFPYLSLVLTCALAGYLISLAAQLETPTTVETIYPDSYMWTGFLDEFNGEFVEGSDDTFTEVFGVFGIQNLDRGGIKFLDASQFRGTAIFDEDFDFFLLETQEFIVDYCDKLEEAECFESGCTQDTLVLGRTILCSAKAFQEFSSREFGELTVRFDIDGNPTGLSNEAMVERVVRFIQEDEVGRSHAGNFGIIDNRVAFVATSFRQTMKVDQPLVVKEPVLALFDALDAEVLNNSFPGTDTFFTTSFDIVWSYTEIGLVTGLFSGMAVSLALSYFIVLFGTRHPLVSLYAIIGVAFIVSCVLGTVQSFGWELGVTEAIAGVMVIGLAVDYIVHLGYMFMAARQRRVSYEEEVKNEELEAKDIRNEDMIRYSVEKMMFTILAGGLTTFAAGLVLFACTLSFFLKMAILIMFTSFYSLTFAFLFFVPVLRIVGPGKR